MSITTDQSELTQAQLLRDARERLGVLETHVEAVKGHVSSVRETTQSIDTRLAGIEKQITFGKGWIGAFLMMASLIGAAITLLISTVKDYVTFGPHS